MVSRPMFFTQLTWGRERVRGREGLEGGGGRGVRIREGLEGGGGRGYNKGGVRGRRKYYI